MSAESMEYSSSPEEIVSCAIIRAFRATLSLMEDVEIQKQVCHVAKLIAGVTNEGGKVLICGNGGSAADAQHFAAELMVRYARSRRPIPAIALTTDTSVLTAHSNDFMFGTVFSRQVEALGHRGDVLIAFSTSGTSPNVTIALKTAEMMGMHTILFTREDSVVGAPMVIKVPATETARIQELHQILYHAICEVIDELVSY